MDRRRWTRVLSMTAAAVLAASSAARDAGAGCNLIPSAPRHLRAALGAINRPFAGPGEIVRLDLRTAVCDQESPGFVSRNPADYVVSVIFTPPSGAPDRNNVVVLAPECTAIADAMRRCDERADVGTATCIGANRPGARLVELLDDDGARVLSVRFPDTDTLVDDPADGRTFTGPTTIAVTSAGAPLPCELASARCADSTSLPGLVACVDELFTQDATCNTERTDVDRTFGHFTALPPVNDYRTIAMDGAESAGPCTGRAPEVRFTVDAAGNALVPIDWRAASVSPEGGALPRRSYGSTTVRALLALVGPIELPGSAFLASYTPSGTLLPPIFGVQTSSVDVSLFGSTDFPLTVVRLARRSPAFRECAGGEHHGLPCVGGQDCPGGKCGKTSCTGGTRAGAVCTSDQECPASECGPALFEFRGRLLGDVGPVVTPRFPESTEGALDTAPRQVSSAPSAAASANSAQ